MAGDAPVDRFVRRAAHPLLRDQVLGYTGYAEHGPDPVRRREVPNGRVTVILSFGDPLDVVEMTNSGTPSGRFTTFVAGLHEGHAVTQHDGHQRGVQVELSPLGAYRLFGPVAAGMANDVVPLDQALGGRVDELTDRLGSASSWSDRFALLDRALLEQADRGPEPDPAVRWAWGQLDRSAGAVPVELLAEEIGWSRRHFGRRFRGQVGLAPKATARVLRFKQAVQLLRSDRRPSISDVAAATGYADHSHLVRECRALAGCTPSELVPAAHD